MKELNALLFSAMLLALSGCAGGDGEMAGRGKAPALSRPDPAGSAASRPAGSRSAPGLSAAVTEAPACAPNKDILPGTDLAPKFDPVRTAAIKELLEKISACRPLLYEHDGIIFANREGLLPESAAGYYHEYTLAVPGRKTGDSPAAVVIGTQTFATGAIFSPRGPERIIVGGGNELYYTPDHYAHFLELHIVR